MQNQTRNPFELIIALVGGVGTNFKMVFHELESSFKLTGCNVEKIKITDYLKHEQKADFLSNLDEKIDKMNKARKDEHKGIGAFLSMMFIFNKRVELLDKKPICPTVYIIDSLKNPHECDVLRNIYGRNFMLLSIYEGKGSRKDNLLNFQLSSFSPRCENLTEEENKHIDRIMDTDENEREPYGRDTKGTYHKAHYFINMHSLTNEVRRLVNLLFNEPFATPTKDESGMLHAYFSSLRSSEPSRQVGAVIMDNDGNILSSGCNEVPKFGGGLHWHDTQPDLREYKMIDENHVPLGERIKKKKLEEKKCSGDDSLEFFRAVHAEEAAICDAARRGISIQGSLLYCTTFPCHLCIKHIIAAGIKEVIYIEPYVKSMTKELFDGLVKDKAPYDNPKVVKLRPFTGVSPKRYRYVFAKSKSDRKDKKCPSRIISWSLQTSSPIYLTHSTPISYFWTEFYIFEKFKDSLEKHFDITKFKHIGEIQAKANVNVYFSRVVEKHKDSLVGNN